MTISCPSCDGTGTIDLTPFNSPSQAQLRPCPECDGMGERQCEAFVKSFRCPEPATTIIDGEAFCRTHALEYLND